MTQKRRRRSKKWISWLVFLALVVAAVVVCYFVWDAYFRDKEVVVVSDDTKSSSKVVEKQEVKKEEKKQDGEEILEKEKVVQYEGEDPNELEELTGVVTYAGAVGENLMIRVNIDQYLSGGKCTLGLRQEGANIYNAEAAIIDAASTSTCEGFNVPLAELPNGHVAIWIFLESGGKTGEIHSEVEL